MPLCKIIYYYKLSLSYISQLGGGKILITNDLIL